MNHSLPACCLVGPQVIWAAYAAGPLMAAGDVVDGWWDMSPRAKRTQRQPKWLGIFSNAATTHAGFIEN
eukprot:scaffold7811_cov92-Cylindrotheca_fusiformis.AAC.2